MYYMYVLYNSITFGANDHPFDNELYTLYYDFFFNFSIVSFGHNYVLCM